MMRESLGMKGHSGAGSKGPHQPPRRNYGGERHVSAGNPLSQDHEVGRDTVRLQCRPGPGSSSSGQDLVGHQQNVIAITQGANPLPVAGLGYRGARGGASNRLPDESGNTVRPFL